MKYLSTDLVESGILLRGGLCLLLAGLIGIFSQFYSRISLLNIQIPLILFHLFTIIPLFGLADKNRQLSLREASDSMVNQKMPNEALAMVGIKKPTLHFYTDSIILYESNTKVNVINLSERLTYEKRIGWEGSIVGTSPGSQSVLILIDKYTSKLSHWKRLNPKDLGTLGIYNLWRVDRLKLNEVANILKQDYQLESSWEKYDPEKY